LAIWKQLASREAAFYWTFAWILANEHFPARSKLKNSETFPRLPAAPWTGTGSYWQPEKTVLTAVTESNFRAVERTEFSLIDRDLPTDDALTQALALLDFCEPARPLHSAEACVKPTLAAGAVVTIHTSAEKTDRA
jgi:hypothetical protein